jgi:DNA-binding CsgD family transcriptional regulator
MNHEMNKRPGIAIVDGNTLSAMGLQALLEEIIPMALIKVFHSIEELQGNAPDSFVHYFVSAQIFVANSTFFRQRIRKTIVLAGEGQSVQLADVRTLNIYNPKEELVKEVLKLHQHAHHDGHPAEARPPHRSLEHELSVREIEVLTLIVRGLINKEIADRLNISITTVISHRKNIMDKLGIRSVSGLTIYAVMNGYVDVDSI